MVEGEKPPGIIRRYFRHQKETAINDAKIFGEIAYEFWPPRYMRVRKERIAQIATEDLTKQKKVLPWLSGVLGLGSAASGVGAILFDNSYAPKGSVSGLVFTGVMTGIAAAATLYTDRQIRRELTTRELNAEKTPPPSPESQSATPPQAPETE